MSDPQSFCKQCQKQRKIFQQQHQFNDFYLSEELYQMSQKEIGVKFKKLHSQILKLKKQNQKKIEIIEKLNRTLEPSKQRKDSFQFQLQQNRKSIEQLKSSLLSFGNDDFQKLTANFFPKDQASKRSLTPKHSFNTSISTEQLINSLQRRLVEYKCQIVKLIETIQIHEKSTEWMYQFIESFLKMVLDINRSGKFGRDNLNFNEISLKKKTKIAWRFLKNILDKFINE